MARPVDISGLRAQDLPATGRVMRRPQHQFQIRTRPYEIAPFLIAPVLPGETMKNLLLQSRVVTDPIVNKLVGWWQEYYIFYVKHRDMPNATLFTSMMLNQNTDVSSVLSGTATLYPTYEFSGALKWQTECLQRIVETYFRDQGEAWNTWTITSGVPAAQINNINTWMQSLTMEDTVAAASIDDGTQTDSEVDAGLRAYEFMKHNGLTNMSYEDYLMSFGVRPSLADLKVPELIRYVRDWQYPSNTIDPTNGTARSAVSWSIAERADKDRFFPEPGFIFGVSITRPKVYITKQFGAATGLLKSAFDWLPAIMADDPMTSVRKKAQGTSILPGLTDVDGYWVDVRDLFLYGDQFVNFSLADTAANFVALPLASMTNKKYPTSTDVDALFVAASPANQIRQDGVVSLSILGRQVDNT